MQKHNFFCSCQVVVFVEKVLIISQLYQHSPNCPNSSKPDTWLSRFIEEKEEPENPRYKLISELYDRNRSIHNTSRTQSL